MLAVAYAYWIACPQYRKEIYQFTLLLGGAFGLVFAFWRCITADNSLKQERYRIGSELLDTKHNDYAARVAGVTTLAALAREDLKNYDTIVMKAFEAFLAFPPGFGSPIGDHKKGDIDYKSRDTEEIVKAINFRTRKQRDGYRIKLPCYAPFVVTDTGDVEANPEHSSYLSWKEAEGQPPSYQQD